MIRINLLPFRAARIRENVKSYIIVYMVVLCALILVMAGGWIYLNSEIQSRNEDISKITRQVNLYKKKALEVDLVRKKLKNLKDKTRVIISLEATKKAPVFLLEAMTSMIVKNRMWLTSMSDKGHEVSLIGIAMDEKTIADFMTNLEAGRIKSNGEFVKGPSKDGKLIFTGVSLKTLKVSGSKRGVSLKSFVISCTKAM